MDDPFAQCRCGKEKIAAISDSVRNAYGKLKTSPEFVEHLNREMEISSCDPVNIALLWIATEVSSGAEFSDGKKAVDRFTLALVYASTTVGADWKTQTNWFSRKNVCDWFGVECDAEGNVQSLLLPNNNLHGSLQTRIGLLSSLITLDLSENTLSGTIPIELWSLPAIGK